MPSAPRRVVWVVALVLLATACGGAGDGAVKSALPADTVGVRTTAPDPDLEAAPADGTQPDDPTAADPLGGASGSGATAPPVATAAPLDPAAAEIDRLVTAMTPEQKVGQLFTVTVLGDDAVAPGPAAASGNRALYGVDTPAEVVQRYHLGGVAYFDHQQGAGTSNVADLTRTAALSQGLQAAAAADTGIGLLIATDQEGGSVVRLRSPATVFPAARQVGTTGDLVLAEQVGLVTAREALAVGVNWIYAPVADVNVNPANPVIGDRAFGTTPDVVTAFAEATARGIAAAGALPTVKHYPGHGDTTVDSHQSLPTIGHDRATLSTVDLPPFAVAAAIPRATVMVGHLAVPALDPSGRPATISAPMIDLLRTPADQGGLGFDGVVVTDAMNMGALSGFGDAGSLAVEAVNAGIDVVLMPTDLPQAWGAVLAAVQDGTIPQHRLDQAVIRILRAKQSIGVLDARTVPATDPSVLGHPEHQAVLQAVRDACAC